MIVLVLVSLIAFNIWLIRNYAPNAHRRSGASDTEPGHPDPAAASTPPDGHGTDAHAEPIGWTALDDQQLNQLLKIRRPKQPSGSSARCPPP
jgi:hypothetical protein